MQIRPIPARAAAALLLLPATALAAPAGSGLSAAKAHDVALRERLVNQNAGSRNRAGVRALADMVRSEFEALGFTTRWLLWYCTRRAGHLDTVFAPDSPFRSFTRKGNVAIGPCIADNKRGVVAMHAALLMSPLAGEKR